MEKVKRKKKDNDKQIRKALLPGASIQGQVLGKYVPSNDSPQFY